MENFEGEYGFPEAKELGPSFVAVFDFAVSKLVRVLMLVSVPTRYYEYLKTACTHLKPD